MERLIHHSKTPLVKVRSVKQSGEMDRRDKPSGLWFSVGDGEDSWRAWCEAESFSLECLTHATELLLSDNAKIRRVCGALEIDALTAEYNIDPPYDPSGRRFGRGSGIDWKRLAESYDGIIIAPYCWARRLEGGSRWYYGWDCASGAIWNAKAVRELRALEKVQ